MTAPAAVADRPRLGIICAVLGAFAFSLNDSVIKLLSGDYSLPQIVFIRGTVAFILIVALIVPFDGGWASLKTKRPKLHILRSFFVIGANLSFFLGLAALQLAEATALFFVAPLLITLFSVVFLRESVGPRRWAAVGFGLLGVLVILRPGLSVFQLAAILPLMAALFYASVHMLTRKLGGTEKASTMAAYIQGTFMLVMGLMGLAFGDGRFAGSGNPSLEFLFRPWVWPPNLDIAFMVMLGVLNAASGYLISQAYRVAPAATVAPFEYVSLIMAIVYGFVLFSELPDTFTWVGIVMIAGSGLFVFWREQVQKSKVSALPPLR